MAASSAGRDDRVLVIEREFDAPRALVWKMFTDPRHAANWMGPPDYPSVLHEADVRPGGKWRGRLRAVDGSRELGQGGEYREVKEPERLAFTFYWDQDNGGRTGDSRRDRFRRARRQDPDEVPSGRLRHDAKSRWAWRGLERQL
jgi:uncharacterized protein YndB with AHSA1/START domain